MPLRTGNRPLPVITVPLDLPVLNTRSFRIAPLLASMAEAKAIGTDPFSASSQRIVSELVVASHRHVNVPTDRTLLSAELHPVPVWTAP